MKKVMKNVMLAIPFLLIFLLLGCQTEPTPPGEMFQVTFVDSDGDILKEIDCVAGEACTITPPSIAPYREGCSSCYFTRWSVFPEDYASLDRDTTIKPIYTKRHGMKPDDLIDGFLWIVPVAILGSRLWYVVFEWSQFAGGGFFPTLLRIIGFESGTLDFSRFGLSGLAIHGAFVTAVVCAFFYTRKRKIDLFAVLDIVAVGFIIAQAFGRWGNFFNQEAHGYVVGGMAGDDAAMPLLKDQYEYLRHTLHLPEFIVNNMYIKAGLHGALVEPVTGFYHPTFFYESMLNLLGFALMLVLRRIRKIYIGDLFALYLIWYGSVRIFIETMRTDPLVFNFFGLTLKSAIVTSSLMVLGGLLLGAFIRIKRKGKTYGTIPGAFDFTRKKADEETLLKP
jgi:phosphatidylglycerol:prolipoprotein diacylglycerol transferase